MSYGKNRTERCHLGILRLLAGLLLCCGFTSCSLLPEIKVNPITLDIPVSGSDWDLSPLEKPDKKTGPVERFVRRLTGPPTVITGLTLEYRAKHGEWPTSLEDLDSSRPGVDRVLKRVKSATFEPKDDASIELSLLYDGNIPANILLTVDREASNS